MANRDVALVIHDGVQALDVAGPLDVFAAANDFLPGREHYRCLLVAGEKEPVRSSNGMWMTPELSFSEANKVFHTVLVAGGPGLPSRPADQAMSEWLQRWGVLAERYGSICNGTFALGHAGLLDGRTVTTHWLCSAELAARFPKARVEHDRIYARDDRLVTSAGVTAGIDLSLALVREDHGSAISLACAKALVVVAQRQGGQSQFSPLLLPPNDAAAPLSKVQIHIMANMREAFSVERLAEIAGVSRAVLRVYSLKSWASRHMSLWRASALTVRAIY